MSKENPGKQWDLVIRSRQSYFRFGLAEIWQYRDLLYLFARRDVVSFYKQTLLGPIWLLIQPLLTTFVYVLVFGRIAGLSTDGLPQVLFYLCGVTLWGYFAECIGKTATVFRDNANLYGKVFFPRIITPLSIVISSLVRFGIQFVLLLFFIGYYWQQEVIRPNWVALLFPVILLNMAVLGLGFGMLISAVTTKYRDLIFLLQFGVQLLMYATPVIYPVSEVPDSIARYLSLNPLSPLFEATRYGFLGSGQFSFSGIAFSFGFASALLVIATVVFNRVERNFMDTV